LNDPVYVEAAAAFARRILTEVPAGSDEQRIRHAHRLAMGREPTIGETEVLAGLVTAQRQATSESLPSAREFCERWNPDGKQEPAEFMAWYAVGATLLNLDETITIP
jgi:hypothetical protein